jgi:hypothetical protein
LVVYLDQNFISEMSKPADSKVRPDFRELYEVLHEGFWDEKLVVPRSGFHDVESSLAGELRRQIRARQSTLGHVKMRPEYAIKERQLTRAIHVHLGRSKPQELVDWEDAFDKPPDERLPHMDIGVEFDRSQGVKEQREDLAGQLDDLRRKIHERGIRYEQQLATEMLDTRRDALSPYKARQYMNRARVTAQEFSDFVASKAFTEVPVFELGASLMAKLFAAHGKRPIRPGDMTDLDAMACYLPYCHLYGTDRMTAELARSLDIPLRYDCELFDARKAGVTELIGRLRGAMRSMEPVNVPHLSVFVVPTPEVKAHSWKLFHTLGNKAKVTERDWGWWVELFGLDDGAMPSYRLTQVPDKPAPFYGFQDVLSKPCPPAIFGDALLELCRGLCRSTHFIVVDSFVDRDEELVAGAAWAMERGEDHYLRWKIHPR